MILSNMCVLIRATMAIGPVGMPVVSHTRSNANMFDVFLIRFMRNIRAGMSVLDYSEQYNQKFDKIIWPNKMKSETFNSVLSNFD